MIHRLVELEREALQLKNTGKIAEAAELFSVIVEEQPDWEHGNPLHDLAQCYEDLGHLELAEKFYRAALECEPGNDIFLGGYASFLYLHGKPEDSFDAHVKLLKVDRVQNNKSNFNALMHILNTLGERMGWSPGVIAERIESNNL